MLRRWWCVATMKWDYILCSYFIFAVDTPIGTADNNNVYNNTRNVFCLAVTVQYYYFCVQPHVKWHSARIFRDHSCCAWIGVIGTYWHRSTSPVIWDYSIGDKMMKIPRAKKNKHMLNTYAEWQFFRDSFRDVDLETEI